LSPAVARILDANVNRAREALRVMEDYARFGLDDPAGCEALKALRHDLADCVRRLPAGELLAARDVPGDAGTAVSTASERHRPDALAVFTAAAKRLPEALRTLEEYAKTFDPELAGGLEGLRYRAYDAEQRIVMRGERSARFARTRLYVLMTASLCGRPDWLWTAEEALAGGADCIQLREKGLDDSELLSRALRLGELCRRRGVLFIVNDRPDIAVLAGADGVHLGQTDLPVAAARRIVGPGALIGVSTHDPAQLRAAIAAGPDYIAVGPMFATATKPQQHLAGPELLALATRETQIPIVPIGGITAGNAGVLVQAGARRLCVCSAVIAAADPRAAARELACRTQGLGTETGRRADA
jgi:thiamine-phosphate pyrophosphorylase